MENTTRSRHNPHQEHRKQLKKNYRYNDSLSKYKKTKPNLVQKQKIESNQRQNNIELGLKNLNSGLTEISTDYNEKEKQPIYHPPKKYDRRTRTKLSLSAPKYHFLKPSTPIIDYNLKEKNIYRNIPTLNNSNDIITEIINNEENEPIQNIIYNFSKGNNILPIVIKSNEIKESIIPLIEYNYL